MTVENTNREISYTGNGSVTIFAYDFLVYSEDHLFIYFDDVPVTAGFTIEGVGEDDGGSVTFVVPPGSGVEIKIERIVPFSQLIEYQQYGPFDAESNERGLDMAAMRDIQTSARVDDLYNNALLKNTDTLQTVAGPVTFAETLKSSKKPIEATDVLRLQDVKAGDALASQFERYPITSFAGQTDIPSPVEFRSAIIFIDNAMQFETDGAYVVDVELQTITLSEPLTGNELVELWVNDLYVTNPTFPNPYIDIRDYGAIENDPTFDNSTAILSAISAAGMNKTVLIYGGNYHCDNFVISQKCRVSGGGTLAPISTAIDTIPLVELTASDSNISGLNFDCLATAVYPLRISGNNNKIHSITAKNFYGTLTNSGSSAALHITGNSNHVSNITVQDFINGDATNPSVPRLITFDSGASYNFISNIAGYNIAAGVVHGGGISNTVDGFVFDNSAVGDDEQRNGIYDIGSEDAVYKNGTIINSAQPIVSRSTNGTYKNINEINGGLDAVSWPCVNALFDGIIVSYPDKAAPAANFMRTRSENEGRSVEGLTIRNCVVNVPMVYASIFAFETGDVNNLLVENNKFTTTLESDTVLSTAIAIHVAGENPRYINNDFIFINNVTPFPSQRVYTINIPANKTRGEWTNNRLESPSQSAFIRVTRAFEPAAFKLQDNNITVANIGTAYIQNGVAGKSVNAISPPNAGVWSSGDEIINRDIDLTPATGFDFKKYKTWVCIQAGDYSDVNPSNHPVFSLVDDLSLAPLYGLIITPYLVSPTEGQQIDAPSDGLVSSAFDAGGSITHASTTWEVSTNSGFTAIVFSSIADAVNLTSITATGLPIGETVYIRVKYFGNGGEESNYSSTRTALTSGAPVGDTYVGKPDSFASGNVGSINGLVDVFVSTNKSLALISAVSGNVYKSTNLTNFSPLTMPHQPTGGANNHIDGSASGSRVICATSDSAVYYSTNASAATPTWTATTGISYAVNNLVTVSSCDTSGDNAIIVVSAIAGDNQQVTNAVYTSSNGAVSATLQTTLSDTYGDVLSSRVAKSNSNFRYVSTRGGATAGGAIYKTSDNTFWSLTLLPGIAIGQSAYDVACSADGQSVYVACSAGRMYRSLDAGSTFAQINVGLVTDTIRSVAMSSDGVMIAFGTQTGGYIRSYDSGLNFALTTGIATDRVRGISVNNGDNTLVMVGDNGDFYKSEL